MTPNDAMLEARRAGIVGAIAAPTIPGKAGGVALLAALLGIGLTIQNPDPAMLLRPLKPPGT